MFFLLLVRGEADRIRKEVEMAKGRVSSAKERSYSKLDSPPSILLSFELRSPLYNPIE